MSDRIGVMFRGAARGRARRAHRRPRGGGPADGHRRARRRRPAADHGGGRVVTAATAPTRSHVAPRPGRLAAAGHCHRAGPGLRRGADDPVQPADRRHSTSSCPITAYKALLQGSVGSLNCDRQHAGQRDAAGAGRPGGRHRLQGRPVQHRRPGPVPGRRPVRRGGGHRAERCESRGSRSRSRSSPACWAAWPGASSLASSRRSRGAHEVVTTIMLNYVAIYLVSYVISGPLRGTGRKSPSPGPMTIHRRRAADHHRPQRPPGHPVRRRRRPARVVAPVPQHHRLRDPHRRRQPRRRALRRACTRAG